VVLNDAPLAQEIPPKTRQHVRNVARRLGYRSNLVARSLRTKRSQTIGVIVSDLVDPYCDQILQGIENALFKSSRLPLVTDIQNNRDRFSRCVQMLLERRVDGLILVANSLSLKTSALDVLSQKTVPGVVIGRETKQFSLSSVTINNGAGTYRGMRHLAELGHRKMAFIKGPKQIVDTGPRWEGICRFAREAGVQIDARLVRSISQPASSFQAGYELTCALLESKRDFTALMAFDDVTAFGAIRALTRVGKRVPEECSVVGFDDVAMAAFYNPPLTTIRQPMELLGTLSVEMLSQVIGAGMNNRRFTPRHVKVEPELVVRESTCAPHTIVAANR
jgi:LacI family transcriptional regulator